MGLTKDPVVCNAEQKYSPLNFMSLSDFINYFLYNQPNNISSTTTTEPIPSTTEPIPTTTESTTTSTTITSTTSTTIKPLTEGNRCPGPNSVSLAHLFNGYRGEIKTVGDFCLATFFHCKKDRDCGSKDRQCCPTNSNLVPNCKLCIFV